MKLLNKIIPIKKALNNRSQIKGELDKLNKRHHPAIQRLHMTFCNYLNADLNTEESLTLSTIETYRENLNASKEIITIYDPSIQKMDVKEEDLVQRVVGDKCQMASKPKAQCRFLFHLIRSMKPETCLELGTCFGISAAYQAAALRHNGQGTLITLEGADPMAEVAKATFNELKLTGIKIVVGRFQDTLNDVLKTNKIFDYVFIDGHHMQKPTIDYFNQIYPYLSKEAVVIFDDIHWSEGMKQAWKTIQSDDRVRVAIDVYDFGICIVHSPKMEKYTSQLPIFSYIPKGFPFQSFKKRKEKCH